ncbi:MAG: efflux RND transporter permease subunit, partial [Bacillota bacterium]
MERLVAASVRRPILVSMVVLAVLLLGGVSLTRMGLDLLPDIEIPVAAVLTVYPGAGPEAVEQQVTHPIESSVSTLPGVSRTSSISRENVSLVVVELNWRANLSVFMNDVNQLFQRLKLTLPPSVEPPVVLRLDPTQLPIAMYGITGSDDLSQLSRATREQLVPVLERVEGVGRVLVSGGTTEEIQVRYDPEQLARVGLTPSQLAQVITYQNVEVPVGPLTEGGRRYQVRAGARIGSLDGLRELPVTILRPGQGGTGLLPQVVELQDVAEVERVNRLPEGYARVNGRPSLLVSVFKESGQNTVTVARRIRKALAAHRAEMQSLDVVPIYDQADFIEQALVSVTRNGAIGGILAVVVLYLFLFDILSTFTIAVAIPISIIATLALMYLNGLTLNLMSLGGLGLGIGMLVDNAIVVLESIFRHAQQGDAPDQAASRGTAEVGVAITASTFTTLVVFLPVIFVGGLAGRIFQELALTVTYSLLASLAVAITVVPAMAVRLRLAQRGDVVERLSALAARRRAGSRWFEPVGLGYQKLLLGVLRRRALVVVGVGAIAAAAVWVYPRLDVEFLTPVDMGRVGVVVEMPPGTPVDETDRAARQLEDYLLRLPEVESVSTQVGSAGSGDLLSALSGERTSTGNLYVVLKPRSQRSRSAAQLVSELRREVPGVLEDAPQARIRVTDSPSFGVLSELIAERVTINVMGPDRQALASLAGQVADRLDKTPGFANVTTSLQAQEPALALRVDTGRALTGGLLAAQVGAGLRDAVQGAPAGHLVEAGGEQVAIVVKADPSSVNSLEGLLNLPVTGLALPGSTPPRVRVERVALPEQTTEPTSIQHRDGQRIVTVNADVEGIGLGEAGERVQQLLRTVDMPAGHGARLAGVHELIGETFGDMWLALALAVVLVYMVMAAQFESLLDPLIIMFTVPLGLAGGLAGLWITGNKIGVTAILGGIVLAGIAVNNGIVLIDHINQLAGRGRSFEDAVVEGASVRLRPVLMTSLTTILGLFPLTLGWGEASELEVPLAVTVVGGMTLATLLTLLVVPAVKYSMGKAVAQRRVPSAALSLGPWILVLVAAAMILAFFAGAGRAAAAPGAAASAAPAWWVQQETVVGGAVSAPSPGEAGTAATLGTWAAGAALRGQIRHGTLRGATLGAGFSAGQTGPWWQLQAGGALSMGRL